ncbi:hypothetical protein [Tenacibaculum finnmarkense]|uniref:Uncharacterized protein n=1 Tax=Tenacibaculum finnmarkense genomovar finnmarkense TaxID=1458503 RepID=A0AAP1RI01_9FLAO|nr:hypothetical protein [Tenacibaculum finnmarkense]MCG8839031.1 hypothetical protein [Tenacibaculum dicentrarchi]MBE7653998.1 hypothetical protein [Tenacibaculum finnmarkense genomovar finnmarkense]MBE7696296.1 hypothetical protein [Tenacibaculum finnmarkense genomovar finnmarkense]MCD8428536.1 hypothetical protein [Tenacibaculum finnmarkense genomovar finnmarkense]SOS49716.1 membrane hypothetical protein [Tenacibaculum finnmarkense]
MKKFIISKKDWKTFPLNSIEFILKEGKDYHEYTLNESDKITKRAYSIILILFGVLSGVIAYTFNKMVLPCFQPIIFVNFGLVTALTIILFRFGILIFPRTIKVKGRIPKKIALPQFLNNPKLSKEENYLSFIIQDIEVVQDKIDFNLVQNKKRQDKLKFNMITVAILFPIYLIIAFFTTL